MAETTVNDVRALLSAEEPDYARVADLGPQIMPHLAQIAQENDVGLAAKATYAAAVAGGEQASHTLSDAAGSDEVALRLAAAGAARALPGDAAADVLRPLLTDADVGVRKVALVSAERAGAEGLRGDVLAAVDAEGHPHLQELGRRVAFGLGAPVDVPNVSLADRGDQG